METALRALVLQLAIAAGSHSAGAMTPASGIPDSLAQPEVHVNDECAMERPNDEVVMREMSSLQEFVELKERLAPSQRVVFGLPTMAGTVLHAATCYLGVPVYVNHPGRLEMWHTFLVDSRGEVAFVQDSEGDYVAFGSSAVSREGSPDAHGAPASAAGGSVPWMRTFPHPIVGVYETEEGGAGVVVVTLEGSYAALTSYATGAVLARGCLTAGDTMRCAAPAAATSTNASTVELRCARSQTPAGHFLSGVQAICLYDLRPASDTNGAPVLYEIIPVWDGRPEVPGSALATYFPNAPFWQSNEHRQNARYCNRYPAAVAAIEAPSGGGVGQRVSGDLNNPNLLWASPYLVRIEGGFWCADTHYWVDYLTRPVGYLEDGTVLLQGSRTVLRIRAQDGSSGAPTRMVKRIQARAFIEALLKDGARGCSGAIDKTSCHWLPQQSKVPRPVGSVDSDRDYSREWFQGIDRAIERIYFKGDEQ